jgi:5-methylcytosine-specific restriction endonuclease McrA
MTKKETQAVYYRRHRRRLLKKAAAYRRQNRIRIRIRQQRYRRQHPQRFAAYQQQWNATPANRLLSLWFGAAKRAKADLRLRYSLVSKPPTHCACCGKKLDYSVGRGRNNRDDSPSLDRHNNAEGYTLENTEVVCWRCNHVKGDATPHELDVVAQYARLRWGKFR